MLVIEGMLGGISGPGVSASEPAALYTGSMKMLGSGGKENACK
jgi:hypothetical protein